LEAQLVFDVLDFPREESNLVNPIRPVRLSLSWTLKARFYKAFAPIDYVGTSRSFIPLKLVIPKQSFGIFDTWILTSFREENARNEPPGHTAWIMHCAVTVNRLWKILCKKRLDISNCAEL